MQCGAYESRVCVHALPYNFPSSSKMMPSHVHVHMVLHQFHPFPYLLVMPTGQLNVSVKWRARANQCSNAHVALSASGFNFKSNISISRMQLCN